jgi:hypothetical protein
VCQSTDRIWIRVSRLPVPLPDWVIALPLPCQVPGFIWFLQEFLAQPVLSLSCLMTSVLC